MTHDSRPTIVFLHGTRLTGSQWAAQVAALEQEFHCLAPDLPGHGTASATPFTLDDASRRVAELIAAEAPDGRAILVGLSLGGFVAMTVAERWPERVTGLVLSGASGDPVGVRSLAYRSLALAFALGPTRVLVAIDRRFVRWRFGAVVAESILMGGLWHRGGVPALRSLVGRRFSRELSAYPGPVLVLNGELDLFFRLTEPAFLRSIGQPSRVIIRRATHLANLDQPEAFTAAVRAFARRVQADAAPPGGRAAGGPMVSSGDRPTPS